jgi:hypothetical protein
MQFHETDTFFDVEAAIQGRLGRKKGALYVDGSVIDSDATVQDIPECFEEACVEIVW